MPLGNRILKAQRKASPEMVEAFRALPVANVSDCMAREATAAPTLRPMHDKGVLAGPALTVRTRPGDNLMLQKALDVAAPGDVVVLDAGGDLTRALMGEMMLLHAINRGIAGLVLNCAIRDVDAFKEQNLPAYAAGITHRGPYRQGPGEINVPVTLDGMIIEPGDLILGDSDGVLSVPFDELESVLAAARDKQAAEDRTIAQIRAGTNDRTWIDAALRANGCDIAED